MRVGQNGRVGDPRLDSSQGCAQITAISKKLPLRMMSRRKCSQPKILKSQVEVSRKDRDVVWLRLTTQALWPTGRGEITVLEDLPEEQGLQTTLQTAQSRDLCQENEPLIMPGSEHLGLMAEKAGGLWEVERALLVSRLKNSLSVSLSTDAAVWKATQPHVKFID